MKENDEYTHINDYNAVHIGLANPNVIREESKGEVKKPETINYRSQRPERDGLFCEKIFGPEKDWECSCGKYRGMKYKGMYCDRCGVKITQKSVRRHRMGHIELAAPVVHIWFFKATPSRLATLLNIKASSLDKIIYFQEYVVVDPGDTPLKVGQLLSEKEYQLARAEEPVDGKHFVAEMGAEAIRKLLQNMDVVKLSEELREEIKNTKAKTKHKELVNRLKLVESLRNCNTDNRPEWMVLDVIPVIPPDIRPLVQLDNGTYATSDLNELYRRIINRNNRLKKLVDLNAPDVIIRNEKRMLQQSVDALFDNSRCKRSVQGQSQRQLKSLTDMIKGKQGRFRENLLGKRVDYSARSVIVVGPKLRLYQCGLPKKIALELYQPFIIRRLKELQHVDTIKSAKRMLERRDEEVWDILEEVIKDHPVLLNRAPTLHRMGIQAFEPILVEGNAIKLHPLVCKGFNADFDGDQMAVHLPLSLEAQVEAHTLMLSTNNIFSPANGRPIISPSQDMVMGCYYMTLMLDNIEQHNMVVTKENPYTGFPDKEAAIFAYSLGKIHLQEKITIRMAKGRWIEEKSKDGKGRTILTKEGERFDTTVGRILFNEILNPGMPFYNKTLSSGGLMGVISDCFQYLGRKETIDLLDRMMRLGFEESTKSGLSFATDDLVLPKDKKKILDDAEFSATMVNEAFGDGTLTAPARYEKTIDIWTNANKKITKQLMETLANDTRTDGYVNPIYLMKDSGARGGEEQIRQLAGMRGLMSKPNGEIIETPVKANFREGLSVLEYFSSTHGARKGLSDTALKTADSGYLTRKLIDVAQNFVVTMHDCGTKKGIIKGAVRQGDNQILSLADAIRGRVSTSSIVDPLTDDLIVKKDELITREIAEKIQDLGIEKLFVRSPLTCEAELGVCALCYGMDLSTSKLVEEGMAVGIIAAQSIGEPGTQLTMRTFHIGGTASHEASESEIRTEYAGVVQFRDIEVVRRSECARKADNTIVVKAFFVKVDDDVWTDIQNRKSVWGSETPERVLPANERIKGIQHRSVLFFFKNKQIVGYALTKGTYKEGVPRPSAYHSGSDIGNEIELMNNKFEVYEEPFSFDDVFIKNNLYGYENAPYGGSIGDIKVRNGRFFDLTPQGCNAIWSLVTDPSYILKDIPQTVESERALSPIVEGSWLTISSDSEKLIFDKPSSENPSHGAKLDRMPSLDVTQPSQKSLWGRVWNKCKNFITNLSSGMKGLLQQDPQQDPQKEIFLKYKCAYASALALTKMERSDVIKIQHGTATTEIIRNFSQKVVKYLLFSSSDEQLYLEHQKTLVDLIVNSFENSCGEFRTFLQQIVDERVNLIRVGEDGEKIKIEAREFKYISQKHSSEPDRVVLNAKPDGGICICNDMGLVRETYPIPEGAILNRDVEEGQIVAKDTILCTIDPHNRLILAKSRGFVKFIDIKDGETIRYDVDDVTGKKGTFQVTEQRGELRPRINLIDQNENILESYLLPTGTSCNLEDGDEVGPGTIVAAIPKAVSGTKDITSGLPRVSEIFEARQPKDPAVIATVDGSVRISESGGASHKRTVIITDINGIEHKHEIPKGKNNILVRDGDEVRAGQPLTDGSVTPRDILDVSGEEALQDYLINEVQNTYRSQNVQINDKHIEVIVAQMLRRVRIEDPGDTDLLEGEIVDKFTFRRKNRELENRIRISEPGDTGLEIGEVIDRPSLEDINAKIEDNGGEPAHGTRPNPAKAKTHLLGISKAAVQSESFISAASFQETTKVLTEAALASKVDRLVGLKENVILGRLIPAGTGFQKYQKASWRYYQQAAEDLSAFGGSAIQDRSYTLMDDSDDTDEMGFAQVADEYDPAKDPENPASLLVDNPASLLVDDPDNMND